MATRRFCPPDSSSGEPSNSFSSTPTKSAASRTRVVDLAVAELHVARAEGDVLIHGLLKQLVLRILEHEADLPFDVAAAYLVGVYVLPADKHSARCRLKQGVEVLGKGRFAASGVPDDADKPPMRYAYVLYLLSQLCETGCPRCIHGSGSPR